MKRIFSRTSLVSGPVLVLGVVVCLGGCDSVEYNRINEAVRADGVERRLEKINGTYRLGATDGIAVAVPNAPNLSSGHTIRPDGNITLEGIGDVYIEGMVPMDAAKVIADKLKIYYVDVDVTVTVTGFNSKKYYIFGESNGTGDFIFDGDVDVLRAFGRARGVTTRAAWDRIRIVRATSRTRQIYQVNFSDIAKDGKWTTNIPILANDVIYVPPTFLARVGYFLDNILFPFRNIFSTAATIQSNPIPGR